MTEMSSEQFETYEALNAAGHAANRQGRFGDARETFQHMYDIATDLGHTRKRLDALNPLARAYWSDEDYSEDGDGDQYKIALHKLQTATLIARSNGWKDEEGIATINSGRAQAVKGLRTVAFSEYPDYLRETVAPYFVVGGELLKGHDHYYYRYAAAQHGVGALALAGCRGQAREFLADGLRVAFHTSPEPYDQIPTYQVNTRGLAQMALGSILIPAGRHTPRAQKIAHAIIR